MTMEAHVREHAVKLYQMGMQLIPLHPNSKKPNLPKGHEFLTRKPTQQEYSKFDFSNYGIVCGAVSGICVLDIDGEEGLETLRQHEIVLADYVTPRVYTPSGLHLYFKFNPGVSTGAKVIGQGVDIRSTGSYVVGPGCRVDGKPYVWSDELHIDKVALMEPPEFMTLRAQAENGRGKWLMGEKLTEGERNEKFASFCGTLVARQLPSDLVRDIMYMVNGRWSEEPLPSDELDKIIDSYERRRR